MKQLIAIFIILASTASVFCQTALDAGDDCFKNGDYACAKLKYQEAINSTSGRDKQIAEIRLSRAKSCSEFLNTADQAFNSNNYQTAKENYQRVIDENPDDTYAKNQIEKCIKAIESSIKLSVSKETVNFSSYSASEIINVNTNANSYSISMLPTWCTVKTYIGYFNLSVSENTSFVERKGWFKIIAGNKEKIIYVNQAPAKKRETLLKVTYSNSLSFDSNKGIAIINVETNENNYNINSLPSWSRVKNKYSNWFSLEYDANTSTNTRSAWFKVTAGNKEERIYISQAGKISTVQSPQQVNQGGSKKENKDNSKRQKSTNRMTKQKSSYHSFFAIGYEGGEIAIYGLRVEFGGTRFVGMFLNARSTVLSDKEILDHYGFLENKNEAVLGFNFKISRTVFINLGGGYGFYKQKDINNMLEQVDYYPVYGGMTFRLGKRINLSGGVSFMDIEENFNAGKYNPEFTVGLTINLKK